MYLCILDTFLYSIKMITLLLLDFGRKKMICNQTDYKLKQDYYITLILNSKITSHLMAAHADVALTTGGR